MSDEVRNRFLSAPSSPAYRRDVFELAAALDAERAEREAQANALTTRALALASKVDAIGKLLNGTPTGDFVEPTTQQGGAWTVDVPTKAAERHAKAAISLHAVLDLLRDLLLDQSEGKTDATKIGEFVIDHRPAIVNVCREYLRSVAGLTDPIPTPGQPAAEAGLIEAFGKWWRTCRCGCQACANLGEATRKAAAAYAGQRGS